MRLTTPILLAMSATLMAGCADEAPPTLTYRLTNESSQVFGATISVAHFEDGTVIHFGGRTGSLMPPGHFIEHEVHPPYTAPLWLYVSIVMDDTQREYTHEIDVEDCGLVPGGVHAAVVARQAGPDLRLEVGMNCGPSGPHVMTLQ